MCCGAYEASHLGRPPWQFDREVVHDKRANTYFVSKDGKRVFLRSLNPSQEMQDQLTSSKVTKKSLFANKGADICQRMNFVLPKTQQGKKQGKNVSGDLVWIRCHKERLCAQRKSKLVPRIDGSV